MTRSALLRLALVGGAISACSTPAPAPTVAPLPNPCVTEAGAAIPVLRAALTGAVNPQHAPVPRNAAEQLVFAQLYERLVTLDCIGTVVPALAESWTVSEQGRVWEFRLRSDAVFWDGIRVTPHAVMQGWSARGATPAVDGWSAASENVLRIELRAPVTDAAVFAAAAFAVARPRATHEWPIGSGPFRIDTTSTLDTLRLRSSDHRIIEFHRLNAADPRTALDAGLDLLVTRDAAVLAYARARADYQVTPLRSSTTWVLAAPRRATSDSLGAAQALFALARDAVRADVRAAQPPFWWQHPRCGGRSAAQPANTRKSNVIGHAADDGIARGIAERLAAVAWPPQNVPAWLRVLLPADDPRLPAPTAKPFLAESVGAPVTDGRALLYIAPITRIPPADCSAVTNLQIVPIIDVRDYLVHRNDVGRMVVDADGSIRFEGRP